LHIRPCNRVDRHSVSVFWQAAEHGGGFFMCFWQQLQPHACVPTAQNTSIAGVYSGTQAR
jgi:hypothetical protein